MDTVVVLGVGGSSHLRNLDVTAVIDDAEGIQQPDDDADHDDGVENFFDLPVHRDVGVDQPEQHADHDQGDDEGYQ
jgi:hypothetical protein